MGYLFALAVIGLWAWLFSAKSPEVFLLLFGAGGSVVALVWLKNHSDEIESKRHRENRERERLTSIREKFQALQLQIVTDNEFRPFAFRSLFDATQSFVGKSYNYPKINDLFFVLNGVLTSEDEAEIVSSFMAEFYDLYGHSASAKKSIRVIEESQESRNEKAKIEREREAQRKRVLEISLSDIDGRTKEDVGHAAVALYIMASKLGVKIGISDEPQKRLGQIQTGHPARVSLSKVIWFFSREDAACVEKNVHDFLRLRKAHASGEWFNIRFDDASIIVGKLIRELVQRGSVDSHRLEIRSKDAIPDIDVSLARLISLPWKISRRGNEWLRLGDKNITIFRRQSRWSYVCAGEYATGAFDTKKEAKVAALQLFLERFGENPPT